MKIPGKTIQIHRWIHAGNIAARIEVNAIIPDADPSEPCLDAQTMKLLDRLQKCAERGDVEEIAKHGEVFVRQSA